MEQLQPRGRLPLPRPLEEQTLSLGWFSGKTRALEPLHTLKIVGRETHHNINPRRAAAKN